MGTIRVQQTDTPTAPAAGFTALSFPATGSKLKWVDGDSPTYSTTIIGSTTASYELTIGGTSTVNGSLVGNISGGGTVETGGFTLTVPATGTAALLATANTFTNANVFGVTTYANTLLARRTSGSGAAGKLVTARFVAKPGTVGASASDGYGPVIEFDLDDAETTGGPLATIGAARDGADNTGAIVMETVTAGAYTERFRISSGGNVGIGTTTTTTGKVSIDQSSATGAIPVLYLDQGDADQDFIEFVGTSGTGNATNISTDAAGAYAGRVQITVNGTRRWIEIYADA